MGTLTLALALLGGCSKGFTWVNVDADDDGYSVFEGDCDDHDANIHPGATDVWYDGVDANCDGLDDFDADQDEHPSAEHGGDDCHDDDPDAYPNSPVEDVWYDCIDQDCDGNDADQDGDGFAAVEVSDGNGGTLLYADTCAALGRDPELVNNAPATDCWDDPDVDFLADYQGEEDLGPEDIYPTEDRVDNETFYDNIDQNCDGWSDFDADGDTYDVDDECDDTNADAYPDPNRVDVPYNCEDEDCDGQDGDLDDDGFIAITWVDDDGVEHDYVAECPGWELVNSDRQEGDCWDDPDVRELPYYPSINGFPTLGAEDVHPGATETWYDGVDQDCAEDNDFDADGDFFNTSSYADRDGWLGNDCQDGDPDANPGAFERCRTDYDDDCDGQVNEVGATDGDDYYLDDDGDGYGDALSTARQQCGPDSSTGYTSVEDNSDCDDANAAIHPNATELPADGVDQDCDDDELCYVDADADGYGDTSTTTRSSSLNCDAASQGYANDDDDCDDANASINPAAAEQVADGVDQNCDDDELCYDDDDGDGYGDTTTSTRSNSVDCDAAASGFADDDDDCNDGDASINPAATELPADGVDQNCDDDELCYVDDDHDTYGSTSTTTRSNSLQCNAASLGYANDSDDCDDTNDTTGQSTYPGAAQLDSSTVCMKDRDNDGFGDDSPSRTGVTAGTDCDDSSSGAAVNPNATEECDFIDNDCDGLTDDDDGSLDTSTGSTFYADADSDGFGDVSSTQDACLQPSGYVADDTDCDDSRSNVYPGANELCSTAYDDDCDGDIDEDSATDASTWYADDDGDTFGDSGSTDTACTQPSGYVSDNTDCDDTNDVTGQRTFPGAAPNDSASACMKDRDQDDYGDDNPSRSGVTAGTDCDDGSSGANINTAAIEICDGLDNDCDGLTDDDDSSVDTSTGSIFYVDADSDGYGDASSSLEACLQPSAPWYEATTLHCDVD
ncbi:MAG: hypothetical protein H6740_14390 [Alphaproteobacteria bacterium]|nr:hypothetical protein [Alphaproteobacteria bacterium]